MFSRFVPNLLTHRELFSFQFWTTIEQVILCNKSTGKGTGETQNRTSVIIKDLIITRDIRNNLFGVYSATLLFNKVTRCIFSECTVTLYSMSQVKFVSILISMTKFFGKSFSKSKFLCIVCWYVAECQFTGSRHKHSVT